MLSKNQIKFINSLKIKKFRTQEQMFLVEGKKAVEELLNSTIKLHQMYATKEYPNVFEIDKPNWITEKELKVISQFSSPNQVIAIFKIPEKKEISNKGLTLLLDGINDPGNLGTIIRMCDWFDVSEIVCSIDTVDCFNPKVVQATMGSIARVSIHYTNLSHFLKNDKRPIYGALLEGENVYQSKLAEEAILIMGNEANGISNEIQKFITKPITIPQFGKTQKTESLNVSTATAILLSEFKR